MFIIGDEYSVRKGCGTRRAGMAKDALHSPEMRPLLPVQALSVPAGAEITRPSHPAFKLYTWANMGLTPFFF